MERLTFSKGFKESEELGELKYVSPEFGKQVYERLAAYEDTGLTPERCAELAKAEREGRLIEMPCKVGDKYYYASDCCISDCNDDCANCNPTHVETSRFRTKAHIVRIIEHEYIGNGGERIYLTLEEAERALGSEV